MHHVPSDNKGRIHLSIILGATLLLVPLLALESGARQLVRPSANPSKLTFSHPGGYISEDMLLEIIPPRANTTIRYTLDGRVPLANLGHEYRRPIRLNTTEPGVIIVRARTVSSSGDLGPVHNATYFVGIESSLPLISLIVAPEDLWDSKSGVFANPIERGRAWERPVHITYSDVDRQSGFDLAGGLRIHGQISRVFDKKSMRLYFRQEYGTSTLQYPVFDEGDLRSFKRLVLYGGGQDSSQEKSNWTLIRNQLVADLAREIGAFAPQSRPVLLFVNGQMWGIYYIRERLDRFFLGDRYGVSSADLLDTPELLDHAVVAEGDRKHWDEFMRFVSTHELADPENYAYVKTQVDIEDLMNYSILQIYSANFDWPYHNVNQFRPRTQGGRWSWLFWDSDTTFEQGFRSGADFDVFDHLLRTDYPATGGDDTLLIRKLLENPEFFNAFLTRTADLLNTTLLPDAVIAHIDALAEEISFDIPNEVVRWSAIDEWESDVEDVREFARLRPEFMRQHYVDRFDLNGVVQLDFNPPSGAAGSVAVNNRLLDSLPWHGIYFQGSTVEIAAAPEPGYRFVEWDGVSGEDAHSPVISVMIRTSQTIIPRFEAVAEDQPRPGDVVFTRYAADDDGQIEGDWFELEVVRPGGIDLRGWRVTDNDTKIAADEGSLIFASHPALAELKQETRILVIATRTTANDQRFSADSFGDSDGQLIFYVGNGHLDCDVDPWFNLGPKDNLVLLAPGPTDDFADDLGIAFVTVGKVGRAVTTASFGVLSDGVRQAP